MVLSERLVYLNLNAHEPATLGTLKVLKNRILCSRISCTLLLKLVLLISGICASLIVPEVIRSPEMSSVCLSKSLSLSARL